MSGVVVALGTFDGVHLGHQAVLRRAAEERDRRGGGESKVVAATFDPHPRMVLNPDSAPGLLTTLDLRREALLTYGAEEVRTIKFDGSLSRKSAEEFVRDVLVEDLGAETVVVGENFRFGYRAAGDTQDLGRLMRSHGGSAICVPIKGENGGLEVSSTRIRALLLEGEAGQAARLLGRPYLVRGEVMVGDKRGRTIGFPTANLMPAPSLIVPDRGVYAGIAYVGDSEYVACINIGVAPTFGRDVSKVEAYLLGFDEDLYGKTIDVGFVGRIRSEKRFSGVDELKAQISRDAEEARRIVDDIV
ncbi:MAG: bifunctional riboflavin kinase/FAD synthetase [Rubrobacteraceae bacterium]